MNSDTEETLKQFGLAIKKARNRWGLVYIVTLCHP
jgi:hypothetical protein